ncbi:phage Gp37/Gp68 family protein [Hyphococcus sp.]|uniref:phage Gp37/Gp68 family protein n=1 Tax=Hyphococcus sp. TaxID=2038636 RepID=UPI00208632FF|nr:MAG: hypothetical protein DHS20C04_32370 [Marinicaulis sp.]
MSSIEWTDETWNPIVGCSLESPGCTNCYAMRMAFRLDEISRGKSKSATGLAHYRGLTERVNDKRVWTGVVKRAPEKLFLKPLKWKKPKTIFVNSMGDLFHESIPDHEIDAVFAIMALCPQHTFQILTKRAERMREYMVQGDNADGDFFERLADAAVEISGSPCAGHVADIDWPLPNVWLGVSAEDQKRADERIPHLLATPAAKRFISAEPLLGPIDLRTIDVNGETEIAPLGWKWLDRLEAGEVDDSPRLDWIIAGGESGPGARPPHPDWFRQLRDDCQWADVPFFFKQWGSWAPAIDRDKDDPDWRSPDYLKANDNPDRFRILNLAGGQGFHGDRIHLMANLGKDKTGAMLDGREHREFPETKQSEGKADRPPAAPSSPGDDVARGS